MVTSLLSLENNTNQLSQPPGVAETAADLVQTPNQRRHRYETRFRGPDNLNLDQSGRK